LEVNRADILRAEVQALQYISALQTLQASDGGFIQLLDVLEVL
jgi:hypothetical protein